VRAGRPLQPPCPVDPLWSLTIARDKMTEKLAVVKDVVRDVKTKLFQIFKVRIDQRFEDHVKLHFSHLTPHTSHLTPHTSHLTPHTSHLTPHTSHLTLTPRRWTKLNQLQSSTTSSALALPLPKCQCLQLTLNAAVPLPPRLDLLKMPRVGWTLY
jgi:hypothetical protein